MTDKPTSGADQGSPDVNRRSCLFKIAAATAATLTVATTLYMAPLALRIADEAEAKGGSKRKIKIKFGSRRRRPKMPSGRRRF